MRKVTKIESVIPKIPKRKRVAAYARVSMETERLNHSLSAQISYYSSLIQDNPDWQYVGVYADSFVTGTSTKQRKEFLRLIEDCEKGKIDIVLCKSISRFARNTVDLLETVRHLKELGVEVQFEQEHINSMSGDGELMLSILASFAQEESRSISENCKWGIRKRFKSGQMRTTKIYGYRIANGKCKVVAEEAAVIRRIFDLYLSGLSFYKIAIKLNEEGHKSYTGKSFCDNVVAQIIRNEKYTGNSLLQKYYVDDKGEKKMVKNNGELPMYYSENTHPAIISQETFDAAQTEIAQRYGVTVKNGIAAKASYFYHHGTEITKADYEKRQAQWSDEDKNCYAEMYKSRSTMKYLHYDLSVFIKCEGCGKNLEAKKRVYADGTPVLFWECHKHNMRIKELGFNEDIPRPVCMKDEKLKEIIAEVLQIEEFNTDIMTQQLSYISSAGDRLTFHFRNGHTEIRQYVKGKRRYVRRKNVDDKESDNNTGDNQSIHGSAD